MTPGGEGTDGERDAPDHPPQDQRGPNGASPRAIVISVDLEPNKDDTLTGVADAMSWFDRVVPRGSIFATHRIATELPGVVEQLAADHGVGVHVHPREFDHDHDELARLPADRQREIIARTRGALADAAGIDVDQVDTFRAGRHSASETTLSILSELGFRLDASVHVRYDEHLPADLLGRTEPFVLPGTNLVELPTSHTRLSLASRCGLRGALEGPVPATAATLRADRWGCPGLSAVTRVVESVETASLYMHPYDATTYHDLENAGSPFRERLRALVAALRRDGSRFVRASDVTPRR